MTNSRFLVRGFLASTWTSMMRLTAMAKVRAATPARITNIDSRQEATALGQQRPGERDGQ
ncbi:MAG: hypothetical protein IPQ26_06165 [Elusimicrobia bacterium]|nr:hypothetical protein [Elusimicrobiota bacterium]